MLWYGTVKNGTVVLERNPKLREGTRVRVEQAHSSEVLPAFDGKALLSALKKRKTGKRDGSANHDRYLRRKLKSAK